MKINHILILGANSGMAEAFAYEAAKKNIQLTLAGRTEEKLIALKSDLSVKHDIKVDYVLFDALDFNAHQTFYEALPVKPDAVLCAFGILGDQGNAEKNWDESKLILDSNLIGAISILNIVANDFEKRKQGVIAGISSVAGERGRQSNYMYGAAKAGFSAYLSGLRNRLSKSDVHVLTFKPGFVNTKMLNGLNTPAPLTATAEATGKTILNGMLKKKNILYYKGIWRLIMYIIKSIPESIFKKLKL
ncbi:MAG: decaprenylphospho-beta-D-erythro-pentofuranosid-2-ulose 2-reductase [Sediminicola sp.]|jgi:decaprenylphospho-beta-D-erythro-pentofuranosid-2-ulose 2-reductase